jgi:hypothetical protein
VTAYESILGQIVSGNPAGEHAVPDYVEALLGALLDEIDAVYDGQKSEEERAETADGWGGRWNFGGPAPRIPGFELRAYYWGDDPTEAAKPNFAFGGVEVRWYKWYGRGMSVNVEMEPAGWVAWFDRALAAVRAAAPADG